MADAPESDQKTEAPTDKRRRESAEKGEAPQVRELGTALLIGSGVTWLIVGGAGLVVACTAMLREGLSQAGAGPADVGASLAAVAHRLAMPLGLFAALVFIGSVAAPLLTAPHFSTSAFMPKLTRINPAAGLKRMFGTQTLVELGKAVIKALLLFGTGLASLATAIPLLMTVGAADPVAAAARVGGAMTALLLALVVALWLVAGIDLPIQLLRHLAKLRMSKQEIRDESKESEGSPEMKAAQRRMARTAARRALAPAMAEASVVVVNPTEFAVALRYVPGRDAAPIVVAKGRDVIAAAIRDLAGERKVPVLRYPQLTRAIYFTAQVGAPIRDDLFAAVAAVLAFVFSLDAAVRRAQPEIEVPVAMRFDERGAAGEGLV